MAYGFQSMVDMAKTPAEIKEDMPQAIAAPKASNGPKVPVYPYGLCISLTEEELAKMNMGDEPLPEVGDMIHLMAMAKVTSVSENERVDDAGNKTKCCRVELQITHLATENENEEDAREEATEQRHGRFYGKVDGDTGKEAA
jgi:hypothetical protein